MHLVTNKTCLVEFTVCPLKAGLGVFVSGTTGPRHAPTQINTPPIGGFYAHKKPELGSGRYLLTGHAVRGFFCCCRLLRLLFMLEVTLALMPFFFWTPALRLPLGVTI